MKFKSALVTQVSGSVGGTTFAHNQGGMYMRARSVPTNPNTLQQQNVRNAMTALSTAWVNTLTAAQRTAWSTYAANVGLVNSLGDTRNVSGIAMYVRSNTPRGQATLSRVDAAPTNFTLGTFTPPTFACTASQSLLSVTFTGTDAWVTGVGNGMLVYISRQQNPSINFFKGPYRYAGKITGTATGATSPLTVALPFAAAAGNKLFVRVEVSLADGRLSTPFQNSVTCV